MNVGCAGSDGERKFQNRFFFFYKITINPHISSYRADESRTCRKLILDKSADYDELLSSYCAQCPVSMRGKCCESILNVSINFLHNNYKSIIRKQRWEYWVNQIGIQLLSSHILLLLQSHYHSIIYDPHKLIFILYISHSSLTDR